MNDRVNQLLLLKKKLEDENREELLKYIAFCKEKIVEKDIEKDIQRYFNDYKGLLESNQKHPSKNKNITS